MEEVSCTLSLDEAEILLREKYVDCLEQTFTHKEMCEFQKYSFHDSITDEMKAMLPQASEDDISSRCWYISNTVQNKLQKLNLILDESRVAQATSSEKKDGENAMLLTTMTDSSKAGNREPVRDDKSEETSINPESGKTQKSKVKKPRQEKVKIACLENKCRHRQMETGDMIRCCLCMAWFHCNCVGSTAESANVWNCFSCRNLSKIVGKLSSGIEEIKCMLKDAMKQNTVQTDSINSLNKTIQSLQNDNSDLNAKNLILAQEKKELQNETKRISQEKQQILKELIATKEKCSASSSSGNPTLSEDETDPGVNTQSDRYSSGPAPSGRDLETDWTRAKPIPRSAGSCQTIITGSSILKSLSTKRLSDSAGQDCCVDSIGGATVATIAERIPDLLHAAEQADTIVIAVGGNDDQSTPSMVKNYEGLLQSIRKNSNIIPVVCSVLPRDQPSDFNEKLPDTNRALRQMCNRMNVHFLDMTPLFPISASHDFLARDGIHLSGNGVRRLARGIANCLRNQKPTSPLRHHTASRSGPSRSRPYPAMPSPPLPMWSPFTSPPMWSPSPAHAAAYQQYWPWQQQFSQQLPPM